MNKTVKIVTRFLLIVLLLSFQLATAGKVHQNKPTNHCHGRKHAKVQMTSYNAEFIHTTQVSGTFTSDIDCKGVLKRFKKISGSFTATPIDHSRAEVVTDGIAVAGKSIMMIRTVFIVNLYTGGVAFVEGEITLKKSHSHKRWTTTNLSATGSFEPMDFNSLTLSTIGRF
jgi:hypothetical protein